MLKAIKMPVHRKTEFQCLMSMPDLGNYVGKWIAIVGEEIVASGDQGKKVFLKAKNKYPKKDPFIMKVPTDVVMCL